MRHEAAEHFHRLDSVDVAAVWPSSAQIAPVPIPEMVERAEAQLPTPAAPDVPAAVGGMIFASYACVILALFVATAGSLHSIFMITISALFVVTFFTVPRIFFRIEPQKAPRVGFDRFMRTGIDTLTGHSSGRDALIQMMIVPVFLTFGILAMGIAAAASL